MEESVSEPGAEIFKEPGGMTSASFIEHLELGTQCFREEGGRMLGTWKQETKAASPPRGAGQGRWMTRGNDHDGKRALGDAG